MLDHLRACVILAATGWGLMFLSAANMELRIVLGLMVGLLLTVFLGTLSRLMIRRPSLVVEPSGLLDSGTLPWSGVGFDRVGRNLGRSANHTIVRLGEAPLPGHRSY